MEAVAGRGGSAVEAQCPRSDGDNSREALRDGRDWSTARQRQGIDGRKEVGGARKRRRKSPGREMPSGGGSAKMSSEGGGIKSRLVRAKL